MRIVLRGIDGEASDLGDFAEPGGKFIDSTRAPKMDPGREFEFLAAGTRTTDDPRPDVELTQDAAERRRVETALGNHTEPHLDPLRQQAIEEAKHAKDDEGGEGAADRQPVHAHSVEHADGRGAP